MRKFMYLKLKYPKEEEIVINLSNATYLLETETDIVAHFVNHETLIVPYKKQKSIHEEMEDALLKLFFFPFDLLSRLRRKSDAVSCRFAKPSGEK